MFFLLNLPQINSWLATKGNFYNEISVFASSSTAAKQ